MAQIKHLPIYRVTYCLLEAVVKATSDFPKAFKYNLGNKLRDEMLARQPYPSWQFDEETLTWSPPVPQPWPGDEWDEAAGEWVVTEQSRESRNAVSLTRAKFKLALLDAGYLQDVKAFVEQTDDERIKIMWEDSATFERGHPDLIRLAAELGYTDEQLDAVFGIGG